MADVRCPTCGKNNPQKLENCQFCGTRLRPLSAATPVDSQPIKAGEQPIKRDTSEFEKVKPKSQDPIHPGEAPTKKDTGELEQALPSWLRDLREKKGASPEDSGAGSLPSQSTAAAPDETPDWLAGLGKAASEEEEEIPDWMSGLRGPDNGQSAPASGQEGPEDGIAAASDMDWMSRLGRELKGQAPEQPPAAAEPLPDWLVSMQAESGAQTPPAAPTAGQGMTSWLQSFDQADSAKPPAPAAKAEETPDWLASLQPAESTGEVPPAPGGEAAPDWLSNLPGTPSQDEPTADRSRSPAPAEAMPAWLSQLKDKAAPPEPTAGKNEEALPDWLSGFGPEPGTPAASAGESVPEWLSNMEARPGTAPETPAVNFTERPPAEGALPDWLASMQADVNAASEEEKRKEEFEVAPQATPEKKQTSPLPEWLAGIQRKPAPAGGTPALIEERETKTPDDEGEAAFSMETPDWLSKLKPEEREKPAAPAETTGEESDQENLEVSELPSWVQAMRPVESVVGEAKTDVPEEDRTVESSGPLAGLRGVLPATPGLGPLRKPPAYSVKLQVTEGQQRYAAYLDRLIASESQPQQPPAPGLAPSRLWRWVISALLILAVLIPLLPGVKSIVPDSTFLDTSDRGAALTLVKGLDPQKPVLIAFDYDPAFSGELEAAAAPLVDQLLIKGTPLALISTSPTGPALAEKFMQDTPWVKDHQAQSVSLGYVPGGPAGMLYFATKPREAAPAEAFDGTSAWDMPGLQNVNKFSDFAAVIILTDNADTGRNWIEQAGVSLGNTPMIMVISAQAEPMIRPYFDSGQIKGLVTGLVDAKLQEQVDITPGLANAYWPSFSLGVLVAEILIVVGAVWGVIAGLRARAGKSGSGDEG